MATRQDIDGTREHCGITSCSAYKSVMGIPYDWDDEDQHCGCKAPCQVCDVEVCTLNRDCKGNSENFFDSYSPEDLETRAFFVFHVRRRIPRS